MCYHSRSSCSFAARNHAQCWVRAPQPSCAPKWCGAILLFEGLTRGAHSFTTSPPFRGFIALPFTVSLFTVSLFTVSLLTFSLFQRSLFDLFHCSTVPPFHCLLLVFIVFLFSLSLFLVVKITISLFNGPLFTLYCSVLSVWCLFIADDADDGVCICPYRVLPECNYDWNSLADC